MKIGILQAGHSPEGLIAEFGEYGEMFPRLLDGFGFTFQVYSVVDGIFPDSVEAADGWLVTGSRYGVYDDLDWIPKLEDFLRSAYDAAVPIVGICFGHQLLAQALGGKVEKFRGGWSVGAIEYRMEGKSLTLNAWHQDQVVSLPAAAVVLGSSDFCPNAMLAYGDKALSFQPHPEFDSGFVSGLINGRGRGVVPAPLLDTAAARLDRPLSNHAVATRIAEFFMQSRD